jgi:hypothetical protein
MFVLSVDTNEYPCTDQFIVDETFKAVLFDCLRRPASYTRNNNFVKTRAFLIQGHRQGSIKLWWSECNYPNNFKLILYDVRIGYDFQIFRCNPNENLICLGWVSAFSTSSLANKAETLKQKWFGIEQSCYY